MLCVKEVRKAGVPCTAGDGWERVEAECIHTHTSLIDGLCKIGGTERAFWFFLKLIKSSSYKPNVHTYTVMIGGGYCKEGKLARARMLLGRMVEEGLALNTNTYTTLIGGHCKRGSFDRAFELMNKMAQ